MTRYPKQPPNLTGSQKPARFLHLDDGYTLFELLIVLLIIGLVAGMMTPRLVSMYDSVQAAYSRDEVFNRLSGLGYAAFQRGKGFKLHNFPVEEEEKSIIEFSETVAKQEDIPLELPEGWQLKTDTPIQFFANGACTGGEATLSYAQQTWQLEFVPPTCRLKVL